MKLYNFFRSGTSHRLRIAMNLKGVSAEYIAVNLRVEAHLKEAFKSLNPQGLVPALVMDDKVLIQSPAIIEWLEETYPTPALLPKDALDRAHVRAMAAMVGCDIHPLNNHAFWNICANTSVPMKTQSMPGVALGFKTALTHSRPCWLRTLAAQVFALAAAPPWSMCI